ncbi:MAG TPA: nucleotide exchange factor GrpE [Armatimonadota bacterium]|jgi:molecular chaperone GrpE
MAKEKHTAQPPADAGVAEPVEAQTFTPDALQEAERRAAEAEQAALRAAAEVQNLKRRQREEMDRIQDTATKEMVLSLLPVVDNLERALEAAGQTENFDALKSGVDLTLAKLVAALKAVGVERLPGVGASFDPELHEAALQAPPSEEFPQGTITQVLRTGYAQHGHLIRPSLVSVAHE